VPALIHPVRPDERAAAEQVVTEAFGDPRIAVMVREIRATPLHWPELELVAVCDGQVVGHVMVSGATLCGDRGARTVAMLTPLAVLPAQHREGIGTALVAAALAAADTRGEPLVVLEGSPDFYGRRGFTSADAAGISIPIPDWAPAAAAQVALLRAYDSEDPTLRGQVVYPPAVAALES
jgi:putative acetyltransferase